MIVICWKIELGLEFESGLCLRLEKSCDMHQRRNNLSHVAVHMPLLLAPLPRQEKAVDNAEMNMPKDSGPT